MTFTTWSGGVKFLDSVVRNFVYLSTVTPLCEAELQLYQDKKEPTRCHRYRCLFSLG